MTVRYVSHLGDDLAPLQAARMSTGNPSGVDEAQDARLRGYLWQHGHLSPFEFADLVVEVDCPIFVARQWMRHRTFSYNEFSGRYAKMDRGYWLPAGWRGQGTGNKQAGSAALPDDAQEAAAATYSAALRQAEEAYLQLLAAGVCREQARAVLPVATLTRFRAKGNLRNWCAFLRERLAPDAQHEIRVEAQQVARIVRDLWPLTYAVTGLPDPEEGGQA